MKKTITILALGIIFSAGFSAPVSAMNKVDLIEVIASDAGLSKIELNGKIQKRVVDVVTGLPSLMAVKGEPWKRIVVIKEILKDGSNGKMAVDSFFDVFTELMKVEGWDGTYKGKIKARIGRNPQTGATIQIKAKTVAKFKAGAALASQVK